MSKEKRMFLKRKKKQGISIGAFTIPLIIIIALVAVTFSPLTLSLDDKAGPHPIFGYAEYCNGTNADGAHVEVTSTEGTKETFVGPAGGWSTGFWQVDVGFPDEWPGGTPFTVTITAGNCTGYTSGSVSSDPYDDMGTVILFCYLGPCYTWVDADADGPGTMIKFNATCSASDVGINKYEWDWENDSIYDPPIYDPITSHDYGDYGPHDCKLRVTDTCDQTATVTHTVQAIGPDYNPPTAVAGGPYFVCVGEPLQLDGCASHDNDEGGCCIVQYDWNFGDGTGWHNDLGCNPIYSFSSSGIYSVFLRVTDDEGDTDTDTTTVTVVECAVVIMEDVYIPEGGNNSAYLKATNVSEDVGSCDFTLSWDPTVVNVTNVNNSDFENLAYHIDHIAGTLYISEYNIYYGLTGDFIIAEITFEAVGVAGDSCTVAIEDSLLLTDDPIPDEIPHTRINGTAYIISTTKLIMEDVCIPLGVGTGSGYLKAENVTEYVGSCQIEMSWDPTVFSVIDVHGCDFDSVYYYIDNSLGKLIIIALNTGVGLTGDFCVAEITFEALTCPLCNSIMEIVDSILLTDDPIPDEISHTRINGVICCCCHCVDGDVNGDCNLNSADVRYLALYLCGDPEYFLLCADGDVNSDGRLNSADVRYLALYLCGDPDYMPLYP